MRHTTRACVAFLATVVVEPAALGAQQPYAEGFHTSNAELVRRGRQVLTVCNGVFVSDRTVEQINGAELRADPVPASALSVDRQARTVAVAAEQGKGPPTRAAWRDGIGCVVMGPDQTFDDVDDLPAVTLPAPDGNPSRIPWPAGDLVQERPLPQGVDAAALEAAGDWTFDREGHGGDPEEMTLSLLVVYQGEIVYERYAPGIDRTTRTRTWSTAKSIASTLIGIAVGKGLLELDGALPFDWPPGELAELESRVARNHPAVLLDPFPPPDYERAPDPRRAVTLRDALNMSSGLYPQDNQYGVATGSSLSYWAGWNSAYQARDRGLVREPGTVWDYENYDTLLGVLALKVALGDEKTYGEFPRRALFDRIGMRNTVPGMDRFGNYVMSSQVYTNARDLARLALLYLNRGQWNGEQILPEWWVDFSRTAAPSTAGFGNFYGGQWWLVPDARTDLPQDAYTTAGARGQHAVVIPSWDLVVVRRGLDDAGLPYWDMVAEILKAFPGGTEGRKRLP